MGSPRSQKEEIDYAYKALGLPLGIPLTQEQFEKVRGLVWTLRKAQEDRVREKVKADVSPKRGEFNPQSKAEDTLDLIMNQRSLLVGEYLCNHQVGPYTLDFAFPREKLCVEVDGKAYHSSPEQITHDTKRTNYLSKLGWVVIRFSASNVHRNPMSVCDEIGKHLSRIRNERGIDDPWVSGPG